MSGTRRPSRAAPLAPPLRTHGRPSARMAALCTHGCPSARMAASSWSRRAQGAPAPAAPYGAPPRGSMAAGREAPGGVGRPHCWGGRTVLCRLRPRCPPLCPRRSWRRRSGGGPPSSMARSPRRRPSPRPRASPRSSCSTRSSQAEPRPRTSPHTACPSAHPMPSAHPPHRTPCTAPPAQHPRAVSRWLVAPARPEAVQGRVGRAQASTARARGGARAVAAPRLPRAAVAPAGQGDDPAGRGGARDRVAQAARCGPRA